MSALATQSLFVGPSIADTPRDGGLLYAKVLSPIGHCLPLSIQLHESVVALVSRLLFVGTPSAVSRLVVAVVADAVKRKTAWLRAHVRQEVLENLPSLANPDSASAVSLEVVVLGIAASSLHPGPSVVCRRNLPVHRAMSMLGASSGSGLNSQAAARPRSLVTQHNTIDDLFGSALTSAVPLRSACIAVLGTGNHSPSADNLAGQVDCSHTSIVSNFRSNVNVVGRKMISGVFA